MFPDPEALYPVIDPDDPDAVHVNVEPVTFAVGVKVAEVLEQIICVNVPFVMLGIGLTVTTKLTGVPTHEEGAGPVGVIVYVTVPEVIALLVRASLILPLPEAVFPVVVPAEEEDVHVNVVPTMFAVGVKVALLPEQIF